MTPDHNRKNGRSLDLSIQSKPFLNIRLGIILHIFSVLSKTVQEIWIKGVNVSSGLDEVNHRHVYGRFHMTLSLSVLQRCVSRCSELIYLHNTAAEWLQFQGFDELCFQSFVSAAVKQGHFLTGAKNYSLDNLLITQAHPCVSNWTVSVYLDAELQVYKCVNVRIVDYPPILQLWRW